MLSLKNNDFKRVRFETKRLIFGFFQTNSSLLIYLKKPLRKYTFEIKKVRIKLFSLLTKSFIFDLRVSQNDPSLRINKLKKKLET